MIRVRGDDTRFDDAAPGDLAYALPGGPGVWAWDLEAGRLSGDARFASLYEVDPVEALTGLPGEVFFRNVHPDDALRLRIAVASVAHGAEVFNRDYRLIGRQGVRWLSARGRAHHDLERGARRFSGILIDISEQKRVEEQLRIAQTAGGVGTFEHVEGFGTVTVAAQFCRLLGLHVAPALPVRTINGLVHPDDPPLIGPAPTELATQLELRIRRADTGEERWLAVRGERQRDTEHAGFRFIGVIYDVTETKKTEAKLRELTRTLEARVEARTQERDRLWNASRDLFAVLDPDCTISSANPAWKRVLGLSDEELIGRRFHDLVHPLDMPLADIPWPAFDGAKEPRDFDVRLTAKDGGSRWINWTVIPLDQAYYAVGRDVTERKLLEEQLRQSQKMEAVGQLTGGLAHDFNNMLTGILGGLDMVSRRIDAGRLDEAGRYIDAASAAAKRAAALTHRLLAFSRRQPLAQRAVDVNVLVTSMQDLLTRTLGEQVELQVSLDQRLSPALSDPNQLENAILNLAINARDAMPDGGTLTIETANSELCGVPGDDESPRGEFVTVRVRDTGVGMPPEVLARVFDPFYTTKPLGQGTGLGLSMVYGFVRQTGGDVRITSEPDAGAVVELYLPKAHVEAVERPPPQAAGAPQGSGECILVVEDDEQVRMLVVDVLDELGYHVEAVGNAGEAVAILESSQRLDVMVSDIGLPGLSGRQLAEIAREARPKLPVLFMTGYAAAAAQPTGFLGPRMEMISKPFEPDALAYKIRRMVED
ncbi:MAG TPA: PAS domain-containing protein [Caulobacteraceae bacterium]